MNGPVFTYDFLKNIRSSTYRRMRLYLGANPVRSYWVLVKQNQPHHSTHLECGDHVGDVDGQGLLGLPAPRGFGRCGCSRCRRCVPAGCGQVLGADLLEHLLLDRDLRQLLLRRFVRKLSPFSPLPRILWLLACTTNNKPGSGHRWFEDISFKRKGVGVT